MTWDDVYAQIVATGEVVVIPKGAIEPPGDAGAVRSGGLPKGQIADWRFPQREDHSGLHVRDFETHWEAHVDKVHPEHSVIHHWREDAPLVWVAIGAGVGAFAGSRAGSAGLGAMLGIAAAAITVAR